VYNRPPELEDVLAIDPVQYDILSLLNVSNEGRLSRLRNRTHQFFQEDLNTIRLIQLAYSLAEEPDEEMVKRIIGDNIKLLNHVFPKVVLHSGIVVNSTPLQLVHNARDPEMCHVLKPFFTKLCGSEEAGIKEMERQIKEKIDDREPKPFDFKPIIGAISNNTNYLGRDPATNKWILSPALLAAIKKFRIDFHRAQARVIDKGVHFRLEIVQALLDAYADVAKNQWNYDYKKCALLEDGVLAWVLGYVSENDAQAFNQGLNYLQRENNPERFERKKKTRDGHNFYEALKGPSVDFVGLVGSCVDIINGGAVAQMGRWYTCCSGQRMAFSGCRFVLQNICRTKTSSLQNLMQPYHRTKSSACIIL